MKFCGNCGNRLEDNAVFCPECGAKAPAGPGQQAPAQPSVPEVTEFQPHMKPDWQQAPAQPQQPQWQQAPAQPQQPQWQQTPSQSQWGGAPVPPPVKMQAPGKEGRFCKECGTRLAPDAIFCPECGSDIREDAGSGAGAVPPVSTPPGGAYYGASGGEKPKKKKLGIVIGVLAVIAVIAALAIFVPKLLVSPKARFLKANVDVFNEAIQPLQDMQDSVSKGISSDITIKGSSSMIPKDAQKIVDDSALVMKMDTTGEALLLNYVLQVSGTNLLSLNVGYEGETASISMPEVTDKCYTMNVPKLLKKNGMDMSITSEDIKKLQGSKEFNDKEMKRYGALLAGAISKESLKVEKKEVRLEHLGARGKYKVYTWHPSPDELKQLMKDIASEIKNDDDLKKRLDEMFEVPGFAQSARVKSASELINQMADACKEAAKEAGQLDEDDIPEWVVAVQGDKTRMISIVADGDPVFTYERADNKDSFEEGVYVLDGRDDLEIYHCKTDKSGKKDGFIGDEDKAVVEFEISDKKDSVFGFHYGTYNVISGKDTVAEITVEGDGKDSQYSVKLPDGLLDLDVSVSSKSTAAKPEGKKTDITDYTDEQLAELGEELGNEIMKNENLMEFFESLQNINF